MTFHFYDPRATLHSEIIEWLNHNIKCRTTITKGYSSIQVEMDDDLQAVHFKMFFAEELLKQSGWTRYFKDMGRGFPVGDLVFQMGRNSGKSNMAMQVMKNRFDQQVVLVLDTEGEIK